MRVFSAMVRAVSVMPSALSSPRRSSCGVRPRELKYFATVVPSSLLPMASIPETIVRAVAGTPGIREMPWAVSRATGNSVSKAAPNALPSVPTRILLRRRRKASSRPVSPVSSSVRRKSGSASKESANVPMPSGDTNMSDTPAARVVVPAKRMRVPTAALPAALRPNASAARPKRPDRPTA